MKAAKNFSWVNFNLAFATLLLFSSAFVPSTGAAIPEPPKNSHPYEDTYGTFGYRYWAPKAAFDYMASYDSAPESLISGQCEKLYAPIAARGVIDIRLALGYFDDSIGKEVIFNGENYGLSPSLDPDLFYAFAQVATRPCMSPSRTLCGFAMKGALTDGKVILEKRVRIEGTTALARITLTHSSASSNFAANQSRLLNRQHQLTALSEQNFFDGVQNADFVYYVGHSRNGGGPDFTPPILNDELKPDYDGFYKIKQPGFNRLMARLRSRADGGPVVGLFSCFSYLHFYKDLMTQNAQRKVILSTSDINYFDAMNAALGHIEGVLEGRCGDDLKKRALQTPALRTQFNDFNVE